MHKEYEVLGPAGQDGADESRRTGWIRWLWASNTLSLGIRGATGPTEQDGADGQDGQDGLDGATGLQAQGIQGNEVHRTSWTRRS